ncbi:hypothetical protein [Streptomyces sp. NPDC050988]|uniref:hypothetical protein n=1 Tax=Streptomyces sp. NPDC050988 TaxID=3365637 RepID=UPI0037ACE9AA
MPSVAHAVLDRAVMIASRRERNFAPELVTVAVHTAKGPHYIEGRTCHRCPAIPAPGWPELDLPTYTFTDLPSTGLYPDTDLETFTRTFERELARPEGLLVLAIHADVPDHDLDDAYAWRYDQRAKSFVPVPRGDAAHLFHEDTTVLTYPWDKAPFASASALCPAEAHPTAPAV